MQHAIASLQATLDTVVNNEPIHRAEGNIAQADLELKVAGEVREAISILKTHAGIAEAESQSTPPNAALASETPAAVPPTE